MHELHETYKKVKNGGIIEKFQEMQTKSREKGSVGLEFWEKSSTKHNHTKDHEVKSISEMNFFSENEQK